MGLMINMWPFDPIMQVLMKSKHQLVLIHGNHGHSKFDQSVSPLIIE